MFASASTCIAWSCICIIVFLLGLGRVVKDASFEPSLT